MTSPAPMFPLNTSQPPTLSPPTPTTHISPIHGDYDPPSSFSQPSAPPPLSTHPSRTASNHSSQIILTPDEMAAQQQQQLRDVISPPLEEPLVMDSMLSAEARPGSIVSDSYFEGVVGLKQDGTALIDKNLTTSSSPYNPYPNSPSTSMHQLHHPYRRPSTMTSPSRGMGVQGQGSSPTMQYTSHRAFSPPGHDRKPIFAMPFTPQQQANGAYALQQQDGMLALPMDQGIKMEKQASVGADDPTTWQRW